MEDLSLILWRERELLDTLLYKLEIEQLVLAGGKSRSIGVIVSNIENPFFLMFPDWALIPMVILATLAAAQAFATTDFRPDLKQLLFILTVTADGAVPIAYRTGDGKARSYTCSEKNSRQTDVEQDRTLLFIKANKRNMLAARRQRCHQRSRKDRNEQDRDFVSFLQLTFRSSV